MRKHALPATCKIKEFHFGFRGSNQGCHGAEQCHLSCLRVAGFNLKRARFVVKQKLSCSADRITRTSDVVRNSSILRQFFQLTCLVLFSVAPIVWWDKPWTNPIKLYLHRIGGDERRDAARSTLALSLFRITPSSVSRPKMKPFSHSSFLICFFVLSYNTFTSMCFMSPCQTSFRFGFIILWEALPSVFFIRDYTIGSATRDEISINLIFNFSPCTPRLRRSDLPVYYSATSMRDLPIPRLHLPFLCSNKVHLRPRTNFLEINDPGLERALIKRLGPGAS